MKDTETIDPATLVRRGLFFTIMIGLAICYVMLAFSGLTSQTGMDQAQIGREIARGNSISTKNISPLEIYTMELAGKEVEFQQVKATRHAPLNLLVYAGVIKIFGGDDPEVNEMGKNDKVYYMDRVIAGTCALFFMISIGINFMLVSKLFDAKIATIVAILMLVSEQYWGYVQSGLPQMLMLMLFSTACYLTLKAIERQEAEFSPLVPAVLSGFIFGLLALTHWLTLWIFVGYVIFAAFYFKPRGIIALFLLVTVGCFVAIPIVFYANHSDSWVGAAFYYFNGNSGAAQDFIFHNFDKPNLNIRDILISMFKTTLLQMRDVHFYLGGFVIASAFFISLLHPFKRNSISHFKWCLVIMWVFAALGMSVFGLTQDELEPNQLHILFMPTMSAFALALISILWARLSVSQQGGVVAQLPFVLIVIITAGPMIFKLPHQIQNEGQRIDLGVSPAANNRILARNMQEADLVFSDQPAAVAWYSDRRAIGLPRSLEQLVSIEKLAEERNSNIIGIHITPSSITGSIDKDSLRYKGDILPLIYNRIGIRLRTTPLGEHPQSITGSLISPQNGRYPNKVFLVASSESRRLPGEHMLYSKNEPVMEDDK